MTVATLDQAPAPKKSSSVIVQVGVLLAMTGMAVGGGWFTGSYMRGEQAGETAKPEAHGAAAAGFAGRAVAYGLLARSRDRAAYQDAAKTMGVCARASLSYMTRTWINHSDVRP